MLTPELLQRCLPTSRKNQITDELVEKLNAIIESDEAKDAVRDNFIGFTAALTSPHHTVEDYLNSVKYISYTMMGDTNNKAWAKVFPERYTRLLEKGVPPKDINAHVRHYNKSKLVNAVRDQSMIPSHILNADVFQEAINTQAELMRSAKSEMVRFNAANSLLTHLKRPEAQKVELDIGMKDNDLLAGLKETVTMLAGQQKKLIESGAYNAKEIAHQQIITVEKVVEVADGELC